MESASLDLQIVEHRYVRDLAEGNITAFNYFYNQYHKPVHQNILKVVKDLELSLEILQDVFLSLWQNRHKIESQKSVSGWLFVVSYHKSLNVLRKKVKESIEYCAEYPPEGLAQEEEEIDNVLDTQMRVLEEAVAILPKRKQEVFKLYRYEGVSKENVADQMGISLQSVNDYLKQSNQAIRKYIAQHYPALINKTLFVFLLSTLCSDSFV